LQTYAVQRTSAPARTIVPYNLNRDRLPQPFAPRLSGAPRAKLGSQPGLADIS
jgi:hypothetical protein